MGMTAGPVASIKEAADYCGVATHKICCGALGAREERDKIRTIHDGTVNFVNGWIQRNIPEKTTAPRPADLIMAAKTLLGMNIGFTILKTDISKAHRRIKIEKKGCLNPACHGKTTWVTRHHGQDQWCRCRRCGYLKSFGRTWHGMRDLLRGEFRRNMAFSRAPK